MAKNGVLGFVIIGFLALILGVAFLVAISNDTSRLTELQAISGESFAGVLNAEVTLSRGNLTAVSAVYNSTGALAADNFTANLTTGTIEVFEPQVNGTFTADYTYLDSDYLDDGGSRSVTALIIIFFAFGVLASIIAVVFPTLRENLGF